MSLIPLEAFDRTESAPRFTLIPFSAITVDTSPDYIVRGIIPREGVTVVYGPSGCGKSFWTFDLLMHVALEWPSYRDRRVRGGPVVYVAAEGASGFRKRVEAFRLRRLAEDHDGNVPFYLLPERLDLVKDHETLIRAIRATTPAPAVVAIDTLNRTLAGSENAPEDMGAYVAAADAIKTALRCSVVIIHHTGVEGSRPRGHTSLTAAADAQIAVVRDSAGNVQATIEKMKDDSGEGDVITSSLETVALGFNDEGDELTSCVVVPAAVAVATSASKRLPPNAATVLGFIRDAGPGGIMGDDLNDKAREAGIGVKRRADLTDIRRKLKERGLVHEYGDRWISA